MTLAITAWQDRVAPRFDKAPRLRLWEDTAPQGRADADLDWSDHGIGERLRRLSAFGVTVLICGGLQPWIERALHQAGIEVISWVSGDIQKVLEAYRAGRLDSGITRNPHGPSRRGGKNPKRK
ncbi:MAG: NifB/NifX family molybdenum-iron cluster-binding protein [Proteobacteria bacterium]|nr:NifB/NifX family molybdenum-iron cluster-binding protein [Pseudomonadota bacterium]MBU1742955.1 NifB/NifX family molybdenum-iron cluster-binding protein [Pseudomonadota bacterium]